MAKKLKTKPVPYSRHVNGRLITVRAHIPVNEEMSYRAGITNRPPISAFRAVYTHGLCPSGVHPAGRDTPGQPPAPYQRQTSAQLHQVAMSSQVLDLLALSAADDWTDAVQPGLQHILTVFGNNPQTDMASILSRPDIQAALNSAGNDGAQAAIHSVTQAWIEEGAEPTSPYLHSILADLDRNGRSFAPRMSDALRSGDRDAVEQTILRDRLRAAAAEATARTRAQAEADLAAMRGNGVTHIKWVADYNNNTPCSACDALNGTVVPIGIEFSRTAGGLSTPVYQNLFAPPRHPNCKCRIVPVSRRELT